MNTAVQQRRLSTMRLLSGLSVAALLFIYLTISSSNPRPALLAYVPPSNLTHNLPDVVIFGVRKGGTRALLEFLGLHPRIVTAHYEMHFFDRTEQYDRGVEWYRRQMPWARPGQLTIEKTPGYFITAAAPVRLAELKPDVKLLLIVREPAMRVLSDYTQVRSSRTQQGLPCKSFSELVIDPLTGGINLAYKAVQISLYHHHYRRWLQHFPAANIHIVDGDRLIEEPSAELADVERFLGLPRYLTEQRFYFNRTKGFYCMRRNATSERCLGASKGRVHPAIPAHVLQTLRQFYAQHNQVFYNMSGRTFHWPVR